MCWCCVSVNTNMCRTPWHPFDATDTCVHSIVSLLNYYRWRHVNVSVVFGVCVNRSYCEDGIIIGEPFLVGYTFDRPGLYYQAWLKCILEKVLIYVYIINHQLLLCSSDTFDRRHVWYVYVSDIDTTQTCDYIQ